MPKESSLVKSITSLPKKERDRIINSLTQEEAEDILYDWEFWARPKQLPPPGDWLTWMIITGRGWGKTRTGSEFVNSKARKGAQHIALIGQTKADVRDTMVEIGPSSILKVSNPNFYPKYESSKRRLIWPNGCIGTIYSGDEPGQVRGPSHDAAWIDELAKFKYPQDIWDNLMFGFREGEDMRVLITTTPRPIPIIKNLINDPNTIPIRGSTFENKENLPQRYFDYVIAPYIGTRLGQQEIEGKILEDNPNALWTRKIIEDNRRNKAPGLIRVAVAVDPQATDNIMSSETGIIGGGLGEDKHVYILEDATIKGSPDQWGTAAVTAYNKLKADRIIGEVNNGGDMVEYIIRSIEPNISYNSVRATRGKYLRAEPVSALYEQGRIHHVGNFPELEDQQCEWVPGEKSPDRLDALVWLVYELLPDMFTGNNIEARSAGRRATARQDW
jgi:phage terminase large subunit-like protein